MMLGSDGLPGSTQGGGGADGSQHRLASGASTTFCSQLRIIGMQDLNTTVHRQRRWYRWQLSGEPVRDRSDDDDDAGKQNCQYHTRLTLLRPSSSFFCFLEWSRSAVKGGLSPIVAITPSLHQCHPMILLAFSKTFAPLHSHRPT